MKLLMSRSQKTGGMINKAVTFCVDARAELSEDERDAVHKYNLGKQVIYNSQAAKENIEKGMSNLEKGSVGGLMKGVAGLALHKFTLNVTIDSLTKGHHIEAQDLDEMLGAEDALRHSCENMKTYLETAATFDGREQVFEF